MQNNRTKQLWLFGMYRGILFILVFCCLAFLSSSTEPGKYALEIPTHVIALLTYTVAYYVVLVCSPLRHLSASALYLLCIGAFHLGFVVPYELDLVDDADVGLVWLAWYRSGNTQTAIQLVLIGIMSYALGFITYNFISSDKSHLLKKEVGKTRGKDAHLNTITAKVSFAMLTSGMLLWFYTLVSKGGFGIFTASYYEYLNISKTSQSTNIAYLLISMGVPILIGTSKSRLRNVGLTIFILWSIVAFLMGLRGEVMFPAVTSVAVLSRGGFRIKLRTLVLIIMILLTTVSAVREIRAVGISNAEISEVISGPISGLTELGAQLRPVVVVLNWEDQGYEFLYGGSYWVPLERLILRFLPYKERISIYDDPRVLNVVTHERVIGEAGIGFSPIAEAYHNFGKLGVIFVLFLFGACFSFLDKLPPTTRGNTILAVIMIPFVFHVRNAFVPFPGQVIFGLCIIFSILLLTKISFRRR